MKPSRATISLQRPLTQTAFKENAALSYLASCTELPFCTVSAIWASCYRGVPGIRFQPIELRLSLFNQLYPISIFTNHSEWLHSDQSGKCLLDQSNFKDLESSFAWGLTSQGPGLGTYVHISQLPSGSQSTLSLSTKSWRLHFPSWSSNTKDVLLVQSWADWTGAEQIRAELSRQKEAALPQGHLVAVLFHSHAAS